MKFSLSWLKDHLDTNASVKEISETLTDIGLEVEQVVNHADALRDFKVAYVKEAEKHPNADKLKLCKVDTGTEILQIVCGASNARAGLKVVLAREGMTIPTNGMKLKKTSIRGVESNGMLCSASELGLSDESEGIIELPQDAKIGDSIVNVLGLDDPLIEIAITPNRPDALGVYGVARDLAASGLGVLLPLEGGGSRWGCLSSAPMPDGTPTLPSPFQGDEKSLITVTIDNPADCPMFIGCTIKGVKNGPSPQWLQTRLKSIGLRPISALVDITNYITFDLGRPLHVYDIAKLKGNIRVTHAKAGEKLAALNDKEYVLSDGMTAITDDSGTIGLGGIIGGVSTGCDEKTTDVFLECALFNPIKIAQTGRKLAINSDARYRFERGVDPAFVEKGASIAVKMILEICGGTASELTVAGKNPHTPKVITFDSRKVESLAGIAVGADETKKILQALGFEVAGANVTVPSFRPDIDGVADLVEEVARIKGYKNIPSTSLPADKTKTDSLLTPLQQRAHIARRLLAARGLMEAYSWSFLSEKEAQLFGGAKENLTLANPISAELAVMRPSLIPNLLSAARRNADRGFADLGLFEVGPQWEEAGQKLVACAVRSGMAAPRNVYKTERAVDAFDAKADAVALLEALGVNAESLKIDREVPGWYHPARTGRMMLGKTVIGHFGELHPAVLKALDVKTPMVACEIFLENLPAAKAKSKTRAALQVSAFQKVDRDFAFLADAKMEAAEILNVIRTVDKQLIVDAGLFDVFSGKNVPEGKKSVAISVTLQAMDRTLTDAEIDGVAKKIIEAAAVKGLALRA